MGRQKNEGISLPNSDKRFKYIDLENELTALLVSDSSIATRGLTAAACMTVNVGSSSDPEEALGLAHLLEHMVFLGSQKFPEENNLDTYLNRHGGLSNASTGMDHTSYVLKVEPQSLEGALERFSELFIAPLLKRDSMDREINAIDSEFELRKQYDRLRLDQIRLQTSTIDHSFVRFDCGNNKSLRKESIERLEALTNMFFNDHYYGASMKLCVIGAVSLSDLETLVKKYFSAIKKKTTNIPAIINNSPKPILDSNTSHLLEGSKGIPALRISWMIPSETGICYMEKPEVYPIVLLRNEGEGSLYASLKNKGWITGINVECDKYTFSILLTLTISGQYKRYELISYIYQYIQLLRDTPLQTWVWKQYWKIKRLEFDSLDSSGIAADPYAFAKHLSANMLKYPRIHIVSADYVNNFWKPRAVESMMKAFTPKRMKLEFIVNSLEGSDIKIEPWYGSRYKVEPIPRELIEKWSINVPETDLSLRFPSKNKFIPTEIKLRAHETTTALAPIVIVDKPLMKMWHKCEVDEKLSYAFICINLNLKDWSYGVKEALIMDLFMELLKDSLSCITFEGKQANLSCSLSISENRLVLQVQGYREKLGVFLSEIWKSFKTFSPRYERFECIKEKMERDLKKTGIEEQARHLLLSSLYEGYYGLGEKIENLKEVSFVVLQEFISVLCSEIFVEALCYGDILETEAVDISRIFEEGSKRQFQAPHHRQFQAPHHARDSWEPRSRIDGEVNNRSDKNSMAKVYFKIGMHEELGANGIAKLSLFEGIVEEMVYNQLRTQEQLGYDVDCNIESTGGVYGLCIYVISSKYNPDYLLKRIDNLVIGLEQQLDEIEEDYFEEYKYSMSNRLFEGIYSTWSEIVYKRYDFNCEVDRCCELQQIMKEDLIQWYKEYFLSGNCRRLSLCIRGCDTKDED